CGRCGRHHRSEKKNPVKHGRGNATPPWGRRSESRRPWATDPHRTDTDPTLRPAEVPRNGSAAVSAAVALVEREGCHGWMPNNPLLAPSAVIDNMPNFQIGVMKAVGRFSFELLDSIARMRGSSSTGPDLERATDFLQFPPDIWLCSRRARSCPASPRRANTARRSPRSRALKGFYLKRVILQLEEAVSVMPV
ncbi:DUF2333 family protein, partial [Cereibacter sphaeroides]|uniref:DUF2333 family protein n=1 Tax=Cereibacter sphaeroides TaxID=1063 RepID=UPI001F3E9397